MISQEWRKALRLENRNSPEFILPSTELDNLHHSSLIRRSFTELNISAFHCIGGVPIVAFIVMNEFEQHIIDETHKALWNQGLATTLMVISGDTIQVYSLTKLPENLNGLHSEDRLVEILHIIKDSLVLKNVLLGIESGRYFEKFSDNFDTKTRIDQVLLNNLELTVVQLVESGMGVEAAQALLMQIMFISYLEDKDILSEKYFKDTSQNSKICCLLSLLCKNNIEEFYSVFKSLNQHFNGELFSAPSSFEKTENGFQITGKQLEILGDFRAGNINIESGQFQFWPYDFRYIPTELISVVYDKFLGFDPKEKRNTGAYYTPIFLADIVVEQSWSELTDEQKDNGQFVDPSCGSGIFLVKLFEKISEHWKQNNKEEILTWDVLKSFVNRLHGFDIKSGAIRVAAFSLYIALLEKATSSEVIRLMERGKLLPKLFNYSLKPIDFFEVDPNENKFDLIIGNPPWVSRKGEQKSANEWCIQNNVSMPDQEISWGFAWKVMQHTRKNAVISMLFRATTFLTGQKPTIVKARNKWMVGSKITKIINFADLRFQLFEGGNAPTALIMYKNSKKEPISDSYQFDYWAPKADLNLKVKRTLTLSSIDKGKIFLQEAIDDPLLIKRRTWMRTPDSKLFQHLNSLPKLSEKLTTYENYRKDGFTGKWIIGQGFNPAQIERLNEPGYKTYKSEVILKIPHLNMKDYQPLIMPTIASQEWDTNIVYRRNFEEGYRAPHILVPQGIKKSTGRIRASFCTQELSFTTSIQSIRFSPESLDEAKLLTVLMNSSLAAWYLFHVSSVAGMERDKVPQSELLHIPFPLFDKENIPESKRKALNDAVNFIDDLHSTKDDLLKIQSNEKNFEVVDDIIFRYFGLNQSDIAIIYDTLNYILPSIQPKLTARKYPKLWKDSTPKDWTIYSQQLSSSLSTWLTDDTNAIVELYGFTEDIAIIGVNLSQCSNEQTNTNEMKCSIDDLLESIWKLLPNNMSGNFQLIPDLKIFIDDTLYLIKPRKMRFWMKSAAIADSDAIAMDLFSSSINSEEEG
jgi:hypothetical protein